VVGHRGATDIVAPASDLPLADTARWAVRAGFRQPVRDYRPDVHLSGSGGDTILSAGPQALACLVSATPGKSPEFVRLAPARARLRQLPVHAVVRSALALSRTSYEQALDGLAAEIRRPVARLSGRAAMELVRARNNGRLADR
jgi:asparagine synthase (glutamine-hydrolysing)